jgi:hypothetical protein
MRMLSDKRAAGILLLILGLFAFASSTKPDRAQAGWQGQWRTFSY